MRKSPYFSLFNHAMFRKQLLFYFITILTPVLIIVTIYIYLVADDQKVQIQQASDESLKRIANNVGNVIEQVNYFSLQLSFMNNLNVMLKDPFQANIYDYATVKEQLRNQISSNPLFYSVYIYSLQDRKVLTTNEGLFTENDFFDKAALELLNGDDNQASTVKYRSRVIKETPMDRSQEVITFYRSIPISAKIPQGMLIINVQKEIFASVIRNMSDVNSETFMILDDDNGIILAPERLNATHSRLLQIDTRQSIDGLTKIESEDGDFFANTLKLDWNGWTIVQIVPYANFKEVMQNKLFSVVKTVLIIAFVGLAISYLFAFIMYSPWLRIRETLAAFVKKADSSENEGEDEYGVVDRTIKGMIETIKQNKPILKDRLIQDLLYHNYYEKSSIELRLDQAGIRFEHAHFLMIVATADLSRPEPLEKNEKHLTLFGLIEQELQKDWRFIGTIIDNARFAYIVNVPKERLDDAFREQLVSSMTKLGQVVYGKLLVSMQFCVSDVTDMENISLSYEQVKRVLNYTPVMNKFDVLFAGDANDSSRFPYPLATQKKLIYSILELQHEKAEACIREWFDQSMIPTKHAYKKLQETIVVMMSNVMNALSQEGYEIDIISDIVDVLKCNECRNRDELCEYILMSIHRLIDYLISLKESHGLNDYVAKAITYMENRYSESLSVSDIAEHIGLSNGHLSRTFKAETGKSPMEYVTELRIQRSKDLLKNQNYTLQKIGMLVGYHDYHGFIRSFKKVEGITPSEYRKALFKN
ncbi:helix-turn-helix domain-containing protein [Paenibacillus chungangensis]|uniref:Helix-turn-helix domain-containing protein n=1 Tax=Paenibacillus chungangensis TaxID=696535 RepID=A0ABW3HR26_9BACL